MSISTMASSGVCFDQFDRLAAGGRGQHLHAAPFQHAATARRCCATSSSTSSTVRPTRSSSERVEPLQHALLFGRQIGDDAVQEQRGLIQQPLRRFHALDDDAARHGVQTARPRSADNSRPVNTTTGTSARRLVAAHAFKHLEARHVRQAQVEHDAVAGLAHAGYRAPPCPSRH